jgi:hypothetical protein
VMRLLSFCNLRATGGLGRFGSISVPTHRSVVTCSTT